jgi:hypothetical protein
VGLPLDKIQRWSTLLPWFIGSQPFWLDPLVASPIGGPLHFSYFVDQSGYAPRTNQHWNFTEGPTLLSIPHRDKINNNVRLWSRCHTPDVGAWHEENHPRITYIWLSRGIAHLQHIPMKIRLDTRKNLHISSESAFPPDRITAWLRYYNTPWPMQQTHS